jgi:hypothetical protein
MCPVFLTFSTWNWVLHSDSLATKQTPDVHWTRGWVGITACAETLAERNTSNPQLYVHPASSLVTVPTELPSQQPVRLQSRNGNNDCQYSMCLKSVFSSQSSPSDR